MTDPPKPLHPWRWNSGAELNLGAHTSTEIVADASVPNQGWTLDWADFQGMTDTSSAIDAAANRSRCGCEDGREIRVAAACIGGSRCIPNFVASRLKSRALTLPS